MEQVSSKTEDEVESFGARGRGNFVSPSRLQVVGTVAEVDAVWNRDCGDFASELTM